MDFRLSEDTLLLKNSAAKFLKEKCTGSFVRELLKDETGFSRELWREMADLGWFGVIYEEAYGGSEASFLDWFVLFEEIGKVVLPSPFFCSAVLAGLIINETEDLDLKRTYLPPIIQGEKILTLALHDESGRCDFGRPGVTAEKSKESDYFLNGTTILVPYAHVADQILVLAGTKDPGAQGSTLFRVDGKSDGMKKTPLEIISGEKAFEVTMENVRVSSQNRIGEAGHGATYVEKIWPRAMILKCGEMLGGLQRTMEMTLDYVKERTQFGRPLGSFQVVQHYCVDMATYLESARLISYQAASLIGEQIPCEKEIAMAKAWCGEAYKKSTWIAHELHGGIGFTEEYDLHPYYKHAKASELMIGDSWFHRSKVADEMGI